MLDLSCRHREGYSLELEVLASLPRWPVFVPMRALVVDFGTLRQQEINRCLHVLRDRGLRIIVTNNSGDGRVCGVHPESWDLALALTEEYWQKVHGAD